MGGKIGLIITTIILFLLLIVFIESTPTKLAPNLTQSPIINKEIDINNYIPISIEMENLESRDDVELIPMEENPTYVPITLVIEPEEVKTEKKELTYYERCGLSEEDFEFFARVVAAEDAGLNVNGFKDYENQVAIACVIWNRVDSPNWPNTVREVLCEKNPTQFSTVKNGECNTITDDYCREAIVDAYENRPLPEDVIYFNCIDFFDGLTPYAKISDNYFSYS